MHSPALTVKQKNFEQLCNDHIEKLVVFDLGSHPDKVGKLVGIENDQIELINAKGKNISMNMNHVKAFQVPE
ncbi:hypothetical protein GCM10007968_19270 [Sporolactobacillus putidus]|uniref:Uncharacterized protein n=1 Tax=Sporolactobacillus putidus TaxID=492735 RepID=A0A917S389_9BACL|nr:hypothetical protein GCM10007968_19270 [Sporolactobacillus putidus]